ncbi:ASKHA domain-containing protein [Hominifimenecus sp. rT4P-3]|uniref:ASKHA domain-containing protein n=1 Tax=Hominifimenecus sp. rT4P-3 TaxID=3242979 RepID=UPI003DA2B1E8
MPDYTVTFVKEEICVAVESGTTLLEAEIQAGIRPDAPCGGQGKCGKCLVKLLDANGVEQVVKACCTTVKEDICVETFDQKTALRILTKGTGNPISFSPSVRKKQVWLPPRKQQNQLTEWERLQDALKEPVMPELHQVRLLSQMETGDGCSLTVVHRGLRVLDLYVSEQEERRMLGAAFDIGTTTIAGYLLNLETGEELANASAINPQVSFGADVIQRANYALTDGKALTECVQREVNVLLGQLCKQAGSSRKDVYQISVVGNSCMHHLFLGFSPNSMVHAPYQPAVRDGLALPASACGLDAAENAEVFLLPLIAGFVGADTVGCLLSTGMGSQEPLTLLIDIGTNGELVLGNRERRIACSTAAGPALEGAKISYGMRGAKGAIEHVEVREGQLHCQVIGGGKAQGICGSGLIDGIAALLELGVMDESGRLCGNDRVDGVEVYWLIRPEEGQPGVFLSQKDIREVQLAKAAIAAGIRLMMETLKVTFEQIKRVYLAGAFGTYLNPDSACAIGLIPSELREKLIPVGNAAGEGAKRILLEEAAWEEAERVARGTEFLELASLPQFQDTFVDELEFPEKERL